RGWRARVLGSARVLGVLTVVWALGSVLAAREARADLDETMVTLGAEMMRLADARQQSAPTALTINGSQMLVSSGMDDRDVAGVLDQFEARCRQRDGHFDAQLERAGEVEVARGGWLDGTLREGDEERGYVACLDLGAEEMSPGELLARVQRFVDTGDLSEVGHLRYAFAERAEHGSHFVAYWTEGAFDLYAMFPPQGDAPGVDLEGVARPPQSRRILSARAGDEPYSLTVYENTSLTADGLERFYRDDLPSHGFRFLEEEEGRAYESESARGLVAERGGRIVVVVIAEDAEGRVTVEMAEME
ncbi:MAG: hypothetical protein M3Y87_24040, partial [Myxococcota bacterium]|nr:hypothetical protein [Myxococcota bacterium]